MSYDKGVTVNKKHKDSLFRIIFKEKKELLSLYNALADTDYDNPDDLVITTRENIIYMSMKNDVSFILDDYMNLYEHQSTFNPNMPLRGLLYISDLYKPMVEGPKLYSKSLVKIPNPRYVVFYNGTQEMPDRKELRLSDAFLHRQAGGDIEVVAHMLNVNDGHNRELLEKCEKLREYAVFVATIRKHLDAGYDLEAAIQLAVEECIRKGILEEILRKERAVIMGSILEEFDEEAFLDMLREESYEEGREEGIKALIQTCREFGHPKKEVMAKITEKFSLTEKNAEDFMQKFWED